MFFKIFFYSLPCRIRTPEPWLLGGVRGGAGRGRADFVHAFGMCLGDCLQTSLRSRCLPNQQSSRPGAGLTLPLQNPPRRCLGAPKVKGSARRANSRPLEEKVLREAVEKGAECRAARRHNLHRDPSQGGPPYLKSRVEAAVTGTRAAGNASSSTNPALPCPQLRIGWGRGGNPFICLWVL